MKRATVVLLCLLAILLSVAVGWPLLRRDAVELQRYWTEP